MRLSAVHDARSTYQAQRVVVRDVLLRPELADAEIAELDAGTGSIAADMASYQPLAAERELAAELTTALGVLTAIAEHTDLLALDARIEAAVAAVAEISGVVDQVDELQGTTGGIGESLSAASELSELSGRLQTLVGRCTV